MSLSCSTEMLFVMVVTFFTQNTGTTKGNGLTKHPKQFLSLHGQANPDRCDFVPPPAHKGPVGDSVWPSAALNHPNPDSRLPI